MIQLSEQQITHAQNNDIGAVTEIVKATEDLVTGYAHQYARTNGRANPDLAEELAQIGRIAVWEAIGRFSGEGVAQFVTYLDRTVKGALSDARKRETRQGVTRQTAANWERAMRHAGGDPYKAEQLATDADVMGDRRMSRDMAYAARLAWQGCESLDAPITNGYGEDIPISETLPAPAEIGTTVDNETEAQRRRWIRGNVRATLDRMGAQQRDAVKGTYGIAPMPFYGTDNEADLAQAVGVDRSRIRSIRARGHARFEALWIHGAPSGQAQQ